MADDDKVVKDGQTPADPPAIKPSAQTFDQAAAPRRPTSGTASEWTASDSRGPLSTAEEERRAQNAVAAGEASGREEVASDKASDKVTDDMAPLASAPTTHPSAPGATDKPATIAHEPSEHVVIDRTPAGPPGPETVSNRSETTGPVYPAAAGEPKRPLWAVAVGIVIGAAIGAGSAAFVYRSVQGDVMSDEVTRLASRVDALEKRPGGQDDTAALKQSVADLEGKVNARDKSSEASVPPVDLAPLQSKIAALQSTIEAVKADAGNANSLDQKVATLESTLNGMKTQASSAQAGVAAVQGEQKELAGKVMVPALAVVADSLVQQIDQGRPYAAQVDALASLGADPTKIAVLRQNAGTGVPSAKLLAAKFEPLAEPLVANPRPAPANAGFIDRLKSGMFGLVSVRRADDTSGNDPASRVARIKMDLAHDDVAGALVAWDGLPEEAKGKGQAWYALAKSHADAMFAARALQQEAIAALGGKKS